jgi:hypothetical protein
MTPQRIQLRRTKGWRLPPNTVVVSRPSKWGNPYKVAPAFVSDAIIIPEITPELAVHLFRENWEHRLKTFLSARETLSELRGKNLACWCALDQPCHADVLLELANR